MVRGRKGNVTAGTKYTKRKNEDKVMSRNGKSIGKDPGLDILEKYDRD